VEPGDIFSLGILPPLDARAMSILTDSMREERTPSEVPLNPDDDPDEPINIPSSPRKDAVEDRGSPSQPRTPAADDELALRLKALETRIAVSESDLSLAAGMTPELRQDTAKAFLLQGRLCEIQNNLESARELYLRARTFKPYNKKITDKIKQIELRIAEKQQHHPRATATPPPPPADEPVLEPVKSRLKKSRKRKAVETGADVDKVVGTPPKKKKKKAKTRKSVTPQDTDEDEVMELVGPATKSSARKRGVVS